MSEENPLQIFEKPISFHGRRNSKGRPCIEKTIKFSAEPKSVISQLLSKMKAENHLRPINDSTENSFTTSDNYETTISEDDSAVDEYADGYKVFNRKKHKGAINEMNNPSILKVYSCDYQSCTYTTKLLSNLTKHKRKHTCEKPYLCDRCSFRSNFANSLKAHSRLHTDVRPYHCQQCKYQCNSISNLKKHCHARHKDIVHDATVITKG